MKIALGTVFLLLSVLLSHPEAQAIVDSATGLEWQQASDNTERNWEDALDYCAGLDLYGHTDWRLPNIRELDSLVDLGTHEPSIDSDYQCELGGYWSSTSYSGNAGTAWIIDFTTGDDGTRAKSGSAFTRCVRAGLDGPVYAPPQIIAIEETGLEWQQSDDGQPKDWQQALAYCEALQLVGNSNWRLPDIRELDSIVDLSRTFPAIDPAFQTQVASYWSSTTYMGSAGSAWSIDFATGDDGTTSKTTTGYARCVRSTEPGTIYEPPPTVTDTITDLEWQQSDDGTTKDWSQALSYCENLELDGKADWRLPNIRELDSLVDLDRGYPAIDPALQTQVGMYWTSTTYSGSSSNAWTINFTSGDDGTTSKIAANYARCVRSAGPAGPVYYSMPTFRQNKTGLEWQQSDDDVLRTWQSSLAYCEGLLLDGKTDWRLPDIRELDSLVDLSLHHPAIDPALQTKLANYWTSTTYTGSSGNAWSVNFATGDDSTTSKSGTNYTRCVRNGPEGSFDDQNDQCGLNVSVIENLLAITTTFERFRYFIDSHGLEKKLAQLPLYILRPGKLKEEISELFHGENSAEILLSLNRKEYIIEKFYDLAKEIITEDTEIMLTPTDSGVLLKVNGRNCKLYNLSLAPFDWIVFSKNGIAMQGIFSFNGHTYSLNYEPYRSAVDHGLKIHALLDGFDYSVDYFSGQDGFGAITEVSFPLGGYSIRLLANPSLFSLRHSTIDITGGISCDIGGFGGIGGGLSVNGEASYVLPRATYGTIDEAIDGIENMGSCLVDCIKQYSPSSVIDYLMQMYNDMSRTSCYLSCVGQNPSIELSIGIAPKFGAGLGAEACVGSASVDISGNLGGNLTLSTPAGVLHSQLQDAESIEKISRFVAMATKIVTEWKELPTGLKILYSYGNLRPAVRNYLAARDAAKVLDALLSQEFKDTSWVSISGGAGLKSELEALGAISAGISTGGSMKIRLQSLIDLILFDYNGLASSGAAGFGTGNTFELGVGSGLGDLGASINTETFSVMVQSNQVQTKMAESLDSTPLAVSNLTFSSDSTPDLDTDGKFDGLTINGLMTVDQTGAYTVYGSLFAEGNCVGIGSLELADLVSGTHPVALNFEGLQVLNSEANGPYQLNVVVFYNDGEEPVFEYDGIYATGSYQASDFQGAALHIDSVVFNGVDTDGNGFFDVLRAEATITAGAELDFTLDGLGKNGLAVSASVSGSSAIGTSQIDLLFDGKEIRKSGRNAPYSFEFRLLDSKGEVHDTLEIDATGFLATQFQMPGLILADQYSDQALDSNGNIFFDELIFHIGVLVSEAKMYRVDAVISSGTGQFKLEKSFYLGPSDTSVSLYVDGREIRRTEANQSYTIQHLSVTDLEGNNYGLRVNPYVTAIYNYLDFEPEPIQLSGTYPVQTIDSNGNGTLDTLRFLVGVNVDAPGLYRVVGRLDCGDHIASTETAVTLAAGSYSVELNFSTSDIFLYGSTGTCTLEGVGIVGEDETYLDFEESGVQTFDYDYRNFDRPCSDDFDGNGTVDLVDLIRALQLMTNHATGEIFTGDCTGDGVVGMPEILHMLNIITEQE